MKPQSCKAKGRRLQQEVRDAVLETFRELEPDDVRSTSMGASGEDLLLSPAARRLFPFSVECKNVERLNVMKAYQQAVENSGEHIPLLVHTKNRKPTLCTLEFSALLELLTR